MVLEAVHSSSVLEKIAIVDVAEARNLILAGHSVELLAVTASRTVIAVATADSVDLRELPSYSLT